MPWILDSLSVILEFRIQIGSGIPECLNCIPDSKAGRIPDSQAKIPGFRNAQVVGMVQCCLPHVAIKFSASCIQYYPVKPGLRNNF